MTRPRRTLNVYGLAAAISISLTSTAGAALVIEPVFNRVKGSGPAENNFPLYDPEFLIDGIAYFTANEPGEVTSYASGDPSDPKLDVFHVWNNTNYELTGFTLRLIGTASDTRNPGTIVRGPVDAVFGDVNGDSYIGQSDIFATIIVSADGKEIRFEDGLIPRGRRFTDIHWAVSDNPPDLAGIDATFTGNFVPEPAGFVLFALALPSLALLKRFAPRRGIDAGHGEGACVPIQRRLGCAIAAATSRHFSSHQS